MNETRNNSNPKPPTAKYRSRSSNMLREKEPTYEQAENATAMIGFQSNDNIPPVVTFSELGSEQLQEDSDENVTYIPQDSRTMGSWSSYGEFDMKMGETMRVHPCDSFPLTENIGGSYDEVPQVCVPIHGHYTRQTFSQPEFVGSLPAETVENYNSLGQCLSPISIEIGTESSTESKTSRRRAQNRAAQRLYRDRRQKCIQDLRAELEASKTEVAALKGQNQKLEERLSALTGGISQLMETAASPEMV